MIPLVMPGPTLRKPLLYSVTVVSLLGFAAVLAWSGRRQRPPKVRAVEACELVRIPGGSFSMGSPPGESQRGSHETPHRVHISALLMGKCEVTQAEWEHACRAGTVTATAFGEAITSRQANFNGEEPYLIHGQGLNLRRTTLIGSYPPNAWGLFDMHGNVSEWCWDWYSSYDQTISTDPRGPTVPQRLRIFRGGSWFSYGGDQRSAARFSDTPYFRLDMLPGGLRLTRTSS